MKWFHMRLEFVGSFHLSLLIYSFYSFFDIHHNGIHDAPYVCLMLANNILLAIFVELFSLLHSGLQRVHLDMHEGCPVFHLPLHILLGYDMVLV